MVSLITDMNEGERSGCVQGRRPGGSYMSLELRREELDSSVDSDNSGTQASGEAITVNAINQRMFSVFNLDAVNSVDKS